MKYIFKATTEYSVFLKFGQAKTDALSIETLSVPAAKQIGEPSSVKWENVASLFWLGNDLDWTAQTVLRGAPKEKILHGLTQCCHHISELGLMGSVPGTQLSSLKFTSGDLTGRSFRAAMEK
jgi:hypothetical protein